MVQAYAVKGGGGRPAIGGHRTEVINFLSQQGPTRSTGGAFSKRIKVEF
jgi:hypothetical protein